MSGRPLRVVVDALSNRHGGGRRYLTSLLGAMRAHAAAGDVHLIVATAAAEDAVPVQPGPGVETRVVRGTHGVVARIVWIQTGLPRMARSERADVIFAPGNVGPLVADRPVVVALQLTPEAAAFDRASWSRRLWWSAQSRLSRASTRKATRAITISHSFRDWVVAHWGVDARSVVAVPYGLASAFYHPGGCPPGESPFSGRRYLLYVGDFQPHKNVPLLVEAFATLADPDLQLVLAGPERGTAVGAVRAAVRKHRLEERVHWLGRVEEAELRVLYCGARALVSPSLAETFGLTVLEAMGCGAPVVATALPSHREVGGEAFVPVSGHDAGELASQLRKVLSAPNLRARLREAGYERARQFTWNRAAADTIAVLQDAAAL